MNLVVEPKKSGKNPFTIICYICGREFGSKSIEIHEAQCIKAWQKNNDSLPKSIRKSKPIKGEAIPSPSDKVALQEYNDQAFQHYQDNTLVECKVCSRRFLPESLKHHTKACKPGGYFEKRKVGH